MKMKKAISLLLCMVMLLCVLPVYAFAETECPHEGCSHYGGVASCTVQADCAGCGCPYGPLAPHYGGTATCTAKAVCTGCGNEYGDTAPHYGGAATCTAKAVCTGCGQEYGSTASHYGGVATCTAKAVCTGCGNEYGDTAPHYGGVATCTAKAVCTGCGNEYGDTAPHYGGKATCSELAECTGCGQKYGSLSEDTHYGGQASCQEQASCTGCGQEYGDMLPCSGGMATCTEQADCFMCGKPYGELAKHTYASTGLCTSCGDPTTEITVVLSKEKATYNGNVQKPSVTVSTGDVVLTSNYTVSYVTDFKNAGNHTVKVTFNGADTTKTFVIEKAKLTVGPAGYTITQNDAYPGLWLSYSGIIGSDKVSVDPAPKLSVYVESGASMDDVIKPMGKHTIYWNNMAAAQSTNPNYELVKYETATLQVIATRADFTIAGVKLYATVDGYAVNMHAVSEKNLQKILDNPNKEGTIELKFKAESYLNYINTVRIPTDLVKEIAKAANDAKSDVKALEVTLINGRSIKFDAEALADIVEEAEGKFVAVIMVKSNDVKTSEAEALTKAQKKDLGDRPAYVFAIASGKEILDDIEGDLVMKIPYRTRDKETVDGLKVYSIDEEGKRAAVETGYDEDAYKVVWNADALGFYVIEHEAAKK